MILCYETATPHICTSGCEFRGVKGVQQGDPLGPFLVSLALQLSLKKLLAIIAPPPPTSTHHTSRPATAPHNPDFQLLVFYMDDAVVVGKHEVLRRVVPFLDSDIFKALGLHLSMAKTALWWPTPPCEDERSAYPTSVRQYYGTGTSRLQAPLGAHDFVRQAAAAHV